MPERPQPAAFKLKGGDTGVLLIHGFPGSPPEMRRIGEYLHAHNCSVWAPLLPGHGTTPEELNRVSWQDWAGHLQGALDAMRLRTKRRFVAGLSGGSLLALYLAGTQPDMAGTITYSVAFFPRNPLFPLLPLGKHLIPYFPLREGFLTDPEAAIQMWHYDKYPTHGADEIRKLRREVKRLLPRVACPLLIVQSTLDRDVHPKGAEFLRERAGSPLKEVMMLHNSGHALTVDSEWELVAERTLRFIRKHSRLGQTRD